jgi:hypothetical protein
MSVIYCFICDHHVDTDFDLSHCEGDDCQGCECNPDCHSWSDEDRLEWEENEKWLRRQLHPTMNELRAESEQAKIAERKERNDQS